jgi:hypothetical protein
MNTDTDALEAARTLVAALPRLSPDLRRIPRGMHDELAGLVSRWLAAGHSPAGIRAHILRGLPDDGTPVRRPGGLLRYLLRDVLPAQEQPSQAPAPPSAADTAGRSLSPRISRRLAGTRECEGDHVQPMLFRPTGEETLCPACVAGTTTVAVQSHRHHGRHRSVHVNCARNSAS